METQEHIPRNDRPDSLEIGTPSKGGAVKVYFDITKPEEARKLVDAAIKLRHETKIE